MVQLAQVVVAAVVTFAAIWLPGAAIIQVMGFARRRGFARPRPVRIIGPFQDL